MMNNKIYSYFLKEFLTFFLMILFTLVAIVWTIQAVNYLDLVTQDGHAFSVYFTYSLLGIPKTISRLLPFTFLVSVILTISKLEKDNELIVLWTSGLNKIKVVNIFFLISIFVFIIQIISANTIAPSSLFKARMMIKNSEVAFFPSLLKERKFNDTIDNLTIFVDKKHIDGKIENIFIREDFTNSKATSSSTTFAKEGYLKRYEGSNYLILYKGVIQKQKETGEINFINFAKTEMNLSKYKSKSVSWPKIQERSSFSFINCLKIKSFDQFQVKGCPYKNEDVITEVNRRVGMPLYIPLIALICCFLLSSRKESKRSDSKKYIYFMLGFIVLIFAEISLRYSGKFFYVTILYYILPFALLIISYLILFRTFKYENLRI